MRKVGDSNPRYGKPVRQFSKLVVSATHPTFQTYSDYPPDTSFVSINIAPESAFATGILRLYYSRFRIASAKVMIFFHSAKHLIPFLSGNVKKHWFPGCGLSLMPRMRRITMHFISTLYTVFCKRVLITPQKSADCKTNRC